MYLSYLKFKDNNANEIPVLVVASVDEGVPAVVTKWDKNFIPHYFMRKPSDLSDQINHKCINLNAPNRIFNDINVGSLWM